MAGFVPAPRPKIVFDNKKLSLYSANAQGKMASLNWGLVSNNPRITVYTNDPNDTIDNGKISANLDAPNFFAFLQILSNTAKSREDTKTKIDNLNFTWPGGTRSKEPTMVSSLIVGKENGVVYISVTAARRPAIKFEIATQEFHHYFHGDGTPYTKAELSTIMSLAYVNMLTPLMTIAMNDNYTPPKPREDNGGGGFGGNKGGFSGGNKGGNYGGGGGGQSQQRRSEAAPAPAPADFEDSWA